MRLIYICSSCKKQNYFKPVYPNRGKLQMAVGDEVRINCKNCGKIDKKHINRIDAVVDHRKMGIAFAISAAVTIVLFFFLGLVGTVTFAIPMLMWLQEGNAVSDFNKYKIRRK